mmetsp:Transcript_1575/g.6293  ORF Transcript_1575/g.6293 Transcript_1575/m.6293 type:complete len:227 (-) Transcript_1575:976-1656(-)
MATRPTRRGPRPPTVRSFLPLQGTSRTTARPLPRRGAGTPTRCLPQRARAPAARSRSPPELRLVVGHQREPYWTHVPRRPRAFHQSRRRRLGRAEPRAESGRGLLPARGAQRGHRALGCAARQRCWPCPQQRTVRARPLRLARRSAGAPGRRTRPGPRRAPGPPSEQRAWHCRPAGRRPVGACRSPAPGRIRGRPPPPRAPCMPRWQPRPCPPPEGACLRKMPGPR